MGTQAPPSWEGGSSAQINCSKCDTGVIHVGRKALSRWGHGVCVWVRRVMVTSGQGGADEGLTLSKDQRQHRTAGQGQVQGRGT